MATSFYGTSARFSFSMYNKSRGHTTEWTKAKDLACIFHFKVAVINL